MKREHVLAIMSAVLGKGVPASPTNNRTVVQRAHDLLLEAERLSGVTPDSYRGEFTTIPKERK